MVLLRLHHAYGIALAHHSQSGLMGSDPIGFEWCQAPFSPRSRCLILFAHEPAQRLLQKDERINREKHKKMSEQDDRNTKR